MTKVLFIFAITTLFHTSIFSQEKGISIKIIPEMSLKAGSQRPILGGQFELAAGALFNNKYFAGIGGGYATNIGMGGHTYPIYLDGRMYFSLPKQFLFKEKDESNNFCLESQIGININNNLPFKTGFIFSGGLSYLFDFIKIKEFKFPSFYAGINIEYSHSKFKDEFRGYVIQDGVLRHIILNIKVAFDIKPIPLK